MTPEMMKVEIEVPIEEVIIGDLVEYGGDWHRIIGIKSYKTTFYSGKMYQFTTTFTPGFSEHGGSIVRVRRMEENETPL